MIFLLYVLFPTPCSQRGHPCLSIRNTSEWWFRGASGLGVTAQLSAFTPQPELQASPMVSVPQGFGHNDFSGLVVNPAILEKNVFPNPNSWVELLDFLTTNRLKDASTRMVKAGASKRARTAHISFLHFP